MPADIVRRIHRDNAGVELQFFGDRVAHHENPCVAACRRRSAAATLFPHRYQRTRTHLATTLQLHSRWCAHPTAMWQDRLAMWSPVKMVYNSKLDEPSMQARKPGHRASLRRHRTHTVVRSHQYDTLRPYARRLRGRVFKRSPPYFSLFRCDPLSAKTICPSAWCFTQHANPTPSTTTHSRTRPFPAHQPNHVIFNPAQDYDRGQAKLEPKKTIYERVQLLQNLQQKEDAQLKLVIGKIRPHPTKLECAEAFNPLLELANNLRADVDTVDTGNVMR